MESSNTETWQASEANKEAPTFPTEIGKDDEETLGNLWTKLPPELRVAVLLQVPLPQRARLRRVSRDWRHFLDACQPLWAEARCFVLDKTINLHYYGISSYDYCCTDPDGRLLAKVRSALEFLKPRVSIAMLELDRDWGLPIVEGIVEALTASGIKLRGFAMLGSMLICDASDTEQSAMDCLSQLVRSQPQLEVLVFNCVLRRWRWGKSQSEYHVALCNQISLMSVTPLAALLQHLRILVLYPLGVLDINSLCTIPAAVLAKLECLAVLSSVTYMGCYCDLSPAIRSYVSDAAPDLKLTELKECKLWCKEDAPVAKAMAFRDNLGWGCEYVDIFWEFVLRKCI